MSWFIYMIHCSDNSLYTGITTDPARRFNEHKNNKGAKYFYSHTPVKIVYIEIATDRSNASKREFAIKKLSAHKKKLLILSDNNKLIKSNPG